MVTGDGLEGFGLGQHLAGKWPRWSWALIELTGCDELRFEWYSEGMAVFLRIRGRPIAFRSRTRSWLTRVCVLACAMWSGVEGNGIGANWAAAREPRVWQGLESSGRRHAVVLACPPGGRPALEPRAADAPRNFDTYRRLEVPSAPQVYFPRGGDRWIRFLNGDVFPFAVSRHSADQLVGIPLGGSAVTIPWGALAAIAQPASETELRVWTAEPDDLAGPPPLPVKRGSAWSGEHSFLVPPGSDLPLLSTADEIPEGGLTLSWLDSDPGSPQETAGDWSLDLVFSQDGSTETVRLLLGDRTGELTARRDGEREFDVRELPHRAGWRHLRVQWNRQRLVVVVDQEILATGAMPNLPCTELRVRHAAVGDRESGPESNRPEVLLDDLRLFHSTPAVQVPPRSAERTGLWLTSGDVVYQPALVERFLNGDPPGGRVTPRDWGFVRGLIPRHTPVAPTPAPLEGWWVRVDWQPRYGERWEEPGFFQGVLQQVTDESLVLVHPWLGQLTVPVELIARLTPLWQGRRKELDPLVHHLGNNTRPGWRAPVPAGTTQKWTIELTAQDLRGPHLGLAVTVRELEPTGGVWGRQGAFHDDLAQGGLLTELWINDQRVTDWNRWLDRPATADDPARLWIPIDPAQVRLGANVFELRQRSSVRNTAEFDDLELWDLTWEQPVEARGGARPASGTGLPRR